MKGDAARVRVRSLLEVEIDAAARVMADTFAEESLFSYALGADVGARARLLRPVMRGMLDGHARFAEREGAFIGEQLAGVALTVRPERFPIGARDMFRVAVAASPAAFRVALRRPGFLRVFRAAGMMEKYHPRDTPCWYMAFFGVSREFRRYGVARDLAQVLLDRADEQQIGCYLDTAGERTMRMCRFLGFEVRHEMKPFRNGPSCWGMWRSPRS